MANILQNTSATDSPNQSSKWLPLPAMFLGERISPAVIGPGPARQPRTSRKEKNSGDRVDRWFLHGRPPASSTKGIKWRLRGVKPLITLKTHVPAGKRKEGGCIALRVPDEVLTLGKTQAAVANGIHRTMNRRKKNIDKFLSNLLDLSSFSQPWG
jgi:hypothetical protein